MANTIDYLRWRGDLTFKERKFNSLDASLFSSFAYLPFDQSTIGHSLTEVCQSILKQKEIMDNSYEKSELLLIPKSPLYRDIQVLDWVDKMESDPEPVQFSAGAFRLDDRTILVAYRGTDRSMIGWSEDMVMNYTPQITGQKIAAKYLNKVGNAFPNDQILITGHSKGGNYAHYALAFADPNIQARIIRSYSFDGPGYRHQIYGTEGFQANQQKMKTYMPESSIVGCMLDHPERVLVVKCTSPATSQHDPRVWSVGRDSYVLAKGLTATARIIRHSLIQFNHTIPAEKRGEMWSALFDAFGSLDITKVQQISGIAGTYRFGRAYFAMEPEMRAIFRQIFNKIIETASQSLSLTLSNRAAPYQDLPEYNDSKRGPIFFDAYDIVQEGQEDQGKTESTKSTENKESKTNTNDTNLGKIKE